MAALALTLGAPEAPAWTQAGAEAGTYVHGASDSSASVHGALAGSGPPSSTSAGESAAGSTEGTASSADAAAASASGAPESGSSAAAGDDSIGPFASGVIGADLLDGPAPTASESQGEASPSSGGSRAPSLGFSDYLHTPPPTTDGGCILGLCQEAQDLLAAADDGSPQAAAQQDTLEAALQDLGQRPAHGETQVATADAFLDATMGLDDSAYLEAGPDLTGSLAGYRGARDAAQAAGEEFVGLSGLQGNPGASPEALDQAHQDWVDANAAQEQAADALLDQIGAPQSPEEIFGGSTVPYPSILVH